MPVNPASIEALRNPDTIAKSLATRKRNRENRELLKQKLSYEKLDAEANKLVNNIKNQVAEENNTATKIHNLEYANKALESIIDNLKEQLRVNTSSITELSNKINIVNPIPSVDSEARDRIKKSVKSMNEALEAVDEKIECNNTEIADIYTKLNNDKLETKIDTLFRLFYASQPKGEQINKYCEYFNTEVQQPPVINRTNVFPFYQ
jgi:chromosome segregation ATPase